MAAIPGAVARAAVGFGLEPERLRSLGGRSGSAWSDVHVLSAPARIWACGFMLADLATRHTRAELAHIRHAMRLQSP